MNQAVGNSQVIGKCPKCGGDVIEGKGYYRCHEYKKSCDFIVGKEVGEVKLTREDIETLLKGEKTKEYFFHWKSGSSGKARLFIDENGKLVHLFPERKQKTSGSQNDKKVENKEEPKKEACDKQEEHNKGSDIKEQKPPNSLGKCPRCGNDVVEGKAYYRCSEYKKSCDFIIGKEVWGVKMTKSDIETLLKGYETGEAEFTWSNGSKGKARLRIESGKLTPIFEQKVYSSSAQTVKPIAPTSIKVIGKCPKCSGMIVEASSSYKCIECNNSLPKEYGGVQLTEEIVGTLLNGLETEEMEFSWSSGKKGLARLKLDENGKIMPIHSKDETSPHQVIDSKAEVVGKCPKCGSDVVDGKEFYVCSKYQDGCDFTFKKVIKGGSITIQDAKDLLAGKNTRVINFVWSNGKAGTAKLHFNHTKLDFLFT